MKDPNQERLFAAAHALAPLLDELVFLGGAITGVLVTDPAAAPLRPTEDVDVILEVGSLAELQGRVRAKLIAAGFAEDASPGSPLCRWTRGPLIVDVMPSTPGILGFSNRWYPEALRSPMLVTIAPLLSMRVIAAPVFLATKLEAFKGRGGRDYQASHDLEDLVAVIDGRPTLLDEVAASPQPLRAYLAAELAELLSEPAFRSDALPGHVRGDASRLDYVERVFAEIAGLSSR